MFAFFQKILNTTNYQALIAQGAIIIDVRTGPEYDLGHIGKAKNIPLDRLPQRIAELKALNVPIICCCASGARSSNATRLLKQHGVPAYNGGNWLSLGNKLGH